MVAHLINGFPPLAPWHNRLVMVAEFIVDKTGGALPGWSATTGIALLLPFTFHLKPLTNLILLTSLDGAAEYGGSMTAVSLHIPGEAQATPTCFKGTERYPFTIHLFEGIPIIPLLMGLFAISKGLMTTEGLGQDQVIDQKISGVLPTLQEYCRGHRAMLRGTVIGYIIGIIPGAGKAEASLIG